MFRMDFETANAAFDDAPAEEICRVLRMVADQARDLIPGKAGASAIIRDPNGNVIGTWSYFPEED